MATLEMGTRDAAQETANRIMDYWAKKGYVVYAWPSTFKTTLQGDEDGEVDHARGWGVRTDMVNGMPIKLNQERMRSALGSRAA